MKKTMAILLSAIILILLCAGTAMGESPAASVMTQDASGQEITAWGWDQPEFNKKVEDYILESAGVTVKGQTMAQGDERAKIIAAAMAGVGLPDSFKLGSYDMPLLMEIGAAMDITDMVEPYLDMLPQVAWDMVSQDGRIYGIPANSPVGGMFYRYDVLEAYGIDPDELTTWDKWIEAGKKVVTESNGEIAWINMPKNSFQGEIRTTIMQQHRAEILTSEDDIVIDSPEFRDALTLIDEIRSANLSVDMENWSAPWYQSMKDGTVACYPSGTWFVQTLIMQAPDTEGLWYFVPFPALEEGADRYPNFGSATCYISSQTDKVEAAFEWCKAWTIDPTGSIRIGLEELGISVISNTALEDSYVNQPHPYFAKNQPYWKVATEAFTKSEYIPVQTLKTSEATTIWNNYFDLWLTGELSMDDAISQAEAEMRTKL